MHRTSSKLTSLELEGLNKRTLRDLNLITRFYYDVISCENARGIIKKPTPRQFYEFIKRNEAVPKTKKLRTYKSE